MVLSKSKIKQVSRKKLEVSNNQFFYDDDNYFIEISGCVRCCYLYLDIMIRRFFVFFAVKFNSVKKIKLIVNQNVRRKKIEA